MTIKLNVMGDMDSDMEAVMDSRSQGGWRRLKRTWWWSDQGEVLVSYLVVAILSDPVVAMESDSVADSDRVAAIDLNLVVAIYSVVAFDSDATVVMDHSSMISFYLLPGYL